MARSNKKKRPLTLAKTSAGFDGRFEASTKMVDDPYEPGRSIRAAVNIRESALEHMSSRNRIDSAQKEAGERFRRFFEKASIGRSMGIDPAKEAVDGGQFGDPLSDDVVRATAHLAKAMQAAGKSGSSILIQVLGEGMTIKEVARKWSDATGIVSGDRAEGYVTGRLIEALDDLVHHWRLIAEGQHQFSPQTGRATLKGKPFVDPERDTIRAARDINVTGPQHELMVGRLGDIVEVEKRPVDNTVLMRQ